MSIVFTLIIQKEKRENKIKQEKSREVHVATRFRRNAQQSAAKVQKVMGRDDAYTPDKTHWGNRNRVRPARRQRKPGDDDDDGDDDGGGVVEE